MVRNKRVSQKKKGTDPTVRKCIETVSLLLVYIATVKKVLYEITSFC